MRYVTSVSGRTRGAASRRRGQLVERAYELLKADLLTCRIRPGDEIFEGQLAARLRLSKTPVREALQRLIGDGLVRVQARRGYVATSITVQDVQEIFRLRLILEPEAAALATINGTDEQLRELQRLAEEHGAQAKGLFPGHAFHAAVAQASGDSRLTRILHALLEQTARVFNLLELTGPVAVPRHAHDELAQALVRRDADSARKLRIRDIEHSQRTVVQRMLTQSAGRAILIAPAAAK